MSSKEQKRVAVIGSGIAGLVIAKVLLHDGFDVVVFEKDDALGGTWDWLERDLTLVTVPGAGHFVHRDAADFVTDTIVRWLGGGSRP